MDLPSTETFLLVGSLLLFFAVVAGKMSYRFGVPTLIFFLLVGMLAGSEGIFTVFGREGITFNNHGLAQAIGILALNFILFSGGLSTDMKEVKPVLKHGLSLSTLGVLITAVLTGVFVKYITPLDWLHAFLLGSIVSSTDSAAVFSVLRAKNLGLRKNLKPMLEFESGSNDPMAYILTITFLGLIAAQTITTTGNIVAAPADSLSTIAAQTGNITAQVSNMPVYIFAITKFLVQLLIGGVLGYVFGRLGVIFLNRIQLEYEGLYFVLTIAIMYLAFSFTDRVWGNGFLAVYVAGLVLGNSKFIHKKTILQTFDGFAWLMQIVLFLTLGLLIFPRTMFFGGEIGRVVVEGVWKQGLVIAVFMILLARPIAVFICTAFFKMDIKSKLFVSWVGLKGAVPIVFATYPFMYLAVKDELGNVTKAGVTLHDAYVILHIVFFISALSLIIQGSTIPFFAKLFKVNREIKKTHRGTLDKYINDDEKSFVREFEIQNNSPVIDKTLIQLNLPRKALVALIHRNKKYIIPDGSTKIEQGDIVMLLAEDKENIEEALKIFK